MCREINLRELFDEVNMKSYTLEELRRITKTLPEGKPLELPPWTMVPVPEIVRIPRREAVPVPVRRRATEEARQIVNSIVR